MSAIAEQAAELAAALATVPGVRVYSNPADLVDPPACVITPPQLTWEVYCTDPTSARWLVYLVVAADDRAVGRLWDLLPAVAAAVDTVPDATVTQATPAAWQAGGVELPAYELTVETGL